MHLVRAFSRQQNVDLLLATTATLRVPEILGLMKFERLPVPDFDVGLYWVTGTRGLVASALCKMGAPRALAVPGAAVLAPALWMATRLSQRWPPLQPDGPEIDTVAPAAAGSEFDALWDEKRKADGRLAVVRTAAVLRWHFAPTGWAVPPVLLTARRRGKLVGYAALVRSDKPDTGLKRWQVADLLALGDDATVIRTLLRAAYDHAVADGAYMLEVFGCPANIRPIIQESRPRTWKKPSWPYLYKVADPQLREALRSPSAWYPTLIDGDGCLLHV
jgi:hypothetical protein